MGLSRNIITVLTNPEKHTARHQHSCECKIDSADERKRTQKLMSGMVDGVLTRRSILGQWVLIQKQTNRLWPLRLFIDLLITPLRWFGVGLRLDHSGNMVFSIFLIFSAKCPVIEYFVWFFICWPNFWTSQTNTSKCHVWLWDGNDLIGFRRPKKAEMRVRQVREETFFESIYNFKVFRVTEDGRRVHIMTLESRWMEIFLAYRRTN